MQAAELLEEKHPTEEYEKVHGWRPHYALLVVTQGKQSDSRCDTPA
jgi:hypothetical protein